MGVDKRLVEYWRRQQAARRRARVAPPEDPRLEPQQPTEVPDEPLLAESGSNVVPMELEDR